MLKPSSPLQNKSAAPLPLQCALLDWEREDTDLAQNLPVRVSRGTTNSVRKSTVPILGTAAKLEKSRALPDLGPRFTTVGVFLIVIATLKVLAHSPR
jgi:hypothetical protein